MDIKAKIEEVVGKIKNDPQLMEKFKKDPVKAVEGVLGVDLPDDLVEKLVTGVKAKLAGDNLSGALGSLKKLF
ncbi:MAG: hypothetical protein MRZ24_06770 [Clostridiales bacterium]|nr:hypothetical protein [Clostridiales bacterium]